MTLDTLSVDLANALSDNKSDSGTLITSYATDGQTFSSAQRLLIINNSLKELFNLLYKLADKKNLEQKSELLYPYITLSDLTPASNYHVEDYTDYNIVFVKKTNNNLVMQMSSQLLAIKETSVLTTYWAQVRNSTGWSIIVSGLSGVPLKVVKVNPPATQNYGTTAVLRDVDQPLLLDICCKNAYIVNNDFEKVKIYNEIIINKLTLIGA